MSDEPTAAGDARGAGPAAGSTAGPAAWTRWELPDLTTHPAELRHTRHYVGTEATFAEPPAPGAAARPRATPYRAALVPFIADQSPTLPGTTATAVDTAAAAVARFDATLRPMTDPYAAALLQCESGLSARAAGFSAGAKTVGLAALGRTRRYHALATAGTGNALGAALRHPGRLDEQTVLALWQLLHAATDPDRRAQWRSGPSVPAGGESGEAAFALPLHDQIPELLGDLMRFLDRRDMPVLVRAAIGHAQFATICPLVDANDRIGRILVHAMLRAGGLTETVVLPISASLVADPAAYRAALEQYRGGQPAGIVDWLATACLHGTEIGRELITTLHTLRASWNDRIGVRAGATSWRLADLLLRRPVVSAASVATELAIAPQNAHRTIAPLVERGVLTEITGSTRNRLWQATEVTGALDTVALRLHRHRRAASEP